MRLEEVDRDDILAAGKERGRVTTAIFKDSMRDGMKERGADGSQINYT